MYPHFSGFPVFPIDVGTMMPVADPKFSLGSAEYPGRYQVLKQLLSRICYTEIALDPPMHVELPYSPSPLHPKKHTGSNYLPVSSHSNRKIKNQELPMYPVAIHKYCAHTWSQYATNVTLMYSSWYVARSSSTASAIST